jgi:hypothetical protein
MGDGPTVADAESKRRALPRFGGIAPRNRDPHRAGGSRKRLEDRDSQQICVGQQQGKRALGSVDGPVWHRARQCPTKRAYSLESDSAVGEFFVIDTTVGAQETRQVRSS